MRLNLSYLVTVVLLLVSANIFSHGHGTCSAFISLDNATQHQAHSPLTLTAENGQEMTVNLPIAFSNLTQGSKVCIHGFVHELTSKVLKGSNYQLDFKYSTQSCKSNSDGSFNTPTHVKSV